MLEQQVPQPRVAAGETQIAIRHAINALMGLAPSRHSVELFQKTIQKTPLDRENEVVEVVERVVERSRRIIDPPGNLARRQPHETAFMNQVRRGLNNQLAQLVCRMKGPAAHEAPSRKVRTCSNVNPYERRMRERLHVCQIDPPAQTPPRCIL